MRKYRLLLPITGWILLGLLIYKIGIDNICKSLGQSELHLLFSGLIIFVTTQLIRGGKWNLLFSGRISIADSIKMYLISLSYSIFSPLRSGDFVVTFFLKKKFDIKISTSVKLILLDKLIDFCVIALFAIFGIFYLNYSRNIFSNNFRVLAIILSILLVLVCISFFICKKNSNLKKKIFRIKEIIAMKKIKKTVSNIFILSFVAFFGEIISGYFIVSSVYKMDFLSYFLLKPISIIIGIFSFIPSGLGVESYSMIELMSFAGYTSIILSSGIIMARVVTMVVTVVIGQVVMLKYKKFNQ